MDDNIDFIDDGRFFGLTNDIVFRIVFSSQGNERLLVLLLNAILQLEGNDQIEDLEILNPFNLPQYHKDKLSIIDVRAKDRAGKRYCIEVQMRRHEELIKRIIYYSSVSYARQLAKGGKYADLNKTLCIWIMGEPLIEEPEIYNRFIISHEKTHRPLTDMVEYHFVELSKFNIDKPANLRTRFEKWLHILKFGDLYRSTKELPEYLKNEAGIEEVVNVMATANTDDYLREIMIGQEMFILDMNTEKHAAREAGHKEGREEGFKSGREEGLKKGREEGREEGEAFLCLNMLERGMTPSAIASATGLSEEKVLKFIDKARKDRKVSEPASKYETRKPRKK